MNKILRLIPVIQGRRTGGEDYRKDLPVEGPPGALVPFKTSPSELESKESKIEKTGVTYPDVTPVPIPNSGALKGLLFELLGLEAMSGKVPELRSVIEGIRFSLANGQNEIPKEIQPEYDDIAINMSNSIRSIVSFLGSSTEGLRQRSILRGIQQAITQIKIRRERYRAINTIDLVAYEEIPQLLTIVDPLNRLKMQLQYIYGLSIMSISWPPVEPWGFPFDFAQYNGCPLSDHRHGCAVGTGIEIMDDVMFWARAFNGPRIFWINGDAGVGKTTIAYSVCEQLDRKKHLGASFFCSNAFPSCSDVHKIIPTIAYQLGEFSGRYSAKVPERWRLLDDSIRDISLLFEQLIVVPLVNRVVPRNTVIVIDALDECASAVGAQKIIELLYQYAHRLSVKFLLTSRSKPNTPVTPILPHPAKFPRDKVYDIRPELLNHDIHLYLTKVLSSVAATSTIAKLSELAGGLFIFATTATCFLFPKYEDVDTGQRLSMLLERLTLPSYAKHSALDRLYMVILSNAFDIMDPEQVEFRKRILHSIVCADRPPTAMALERIHLMVPGDLLAIVQPLFPVIHFDSTTGIISPQHVSFREFYLDPERSGKYYWAQGQGQGPLVLRAFGIMREGLSFNICNLETSMKLDHEVPDLHARVHQAIPLILFQACCAWSEHLEKETLSSVLLEQLDDFFRQRFLFWMEALNLKGSLGKGEGILSRALKWLSKADEAHELCEVIRDARDFVKAYNSSAASYSTPHIYVSALPVLPKNNHVYRNYWPRMQGLNAIQRVAESMSQLLMGEVSSLGFSPDGSQMVTASEDGMLCIWNMDSGSQTLGPTNKSADLLITHSITSLPGALRASQADDELACTVNPRLVHRLFARKSQLLSVALIPNKNHMICGFADGMLHTYNLDTGTILNRKRIFHHLPITTLTLSPEGSYLLIGDESGYVWLYSVQHPEPPVAIDHNCFTLAISPDGRMVAFVRAQGTIVSMSVYWSIQNIGGAEGQIQISRDLSDVDMSPWGEYAPCLVSFSASGKSLVGVTQVRIMAWDMHLGTKLFSIERNSHEIPLALLLNDDYLVLGFKGGLVHSMNTDDLYFKSHDDTQKPLAEPVDWSIDEDGWMIGPGSQRVLCLPGDSKWRSELEHEDVWLSRWLFSNFDRGVILGDLSKFGVGERWHECYVGPTGPGLHDRPKGESQLPHHVDN